MDRVLVAWGLTFLGFKESSCTDIATKGRGAQQEVCSLLRIDDSHIEDHASVKVDGIEVSTGANIDTKSLCGQDGRRDLHEEHLLLGNFAEGQSEPNPVEGSREPLTIFALMKIAT